MVIRLVRPDDARAVRKLVMRYLKETYDQGGDFPPTLDNAAAFTQHAIVGAQELDPCLVAVDEDGTIAGFCVGRGVHFPGMQTRDKTLRSWGTYVKPEYRQRHVALQLFMVLGRVARYQGYTRVMGFTHGTGYAENAQKVIKSIVGMQEVGTVLVWPLVPPAEATVATDAEVAP